MAEKNILVVDDESIIGLAFDRELSEKGYHVDSVLSGEEAIKAVQQKAYDVIFIDKVMPGMDGIQTCKAILKISPDSVPVFMTGVLDKENMFKEWQFTQAGGKTYYLYKPFAKGELYEVLLKALGKSSTR